MLWECSHRGEEITCTHYLLTPQRSVSSASFRDFRESIRKKALEFFFLEMERHARVSLEGNAIGSRW